MIGVEELRQRMAVVDSAMEWSGTPYRHHARVRGAGIDCAKLIIKTFAGAGLVEDFDPGKYTHDWHLHREEERYLEIVEQHLRWSDGIEASILERGPDFRCHPGDVALFRFGKTISHGGIITRWPRIIHASYPDGCVLEVDMRGTRLERLPMRVYTYWGDPA